MDFNDNYPQYEIQALHSEDEGKVVRKKLWKVFWIMLFVTIVELIIGNFQDDWHLTGTIALKFIYIIFTIIKAGYIVYSFMHLGDENHLMRKVILWPYVSFALYLVFMCTVTEGNFTRDRKSYLGVEYVKQRQESRDKAQHGNSGDHGGEQHKDGAH